MKRAFEDFVQARLPVHGLAACVLRLPDGTVTDKCFTRWLSPPQIQQVFAELTDISDVLRQRQFAVTQLAWVFEHLRVIVRSRPDQACLGLFLENRPDLNLEEVEDVLAGFAELQAPTGS